MRLHCKMAVTTALSSRDGVMYVGVIPKPGQAKVNCYLENINVKDLKRVKIKGVNKI